MFDVNACIANVKAAHRAFCNGYECCKKSTVATACYTNMHSILGAFASSCRTSLAATNSNLK